jgi:hypothetical protein
LHLAIALVFFWHAQNFDAGSGESFLKDFFKKLAQTCCRLLLFYHQKGENNDLSDSEASQSTNDECSIRALVQTCSYQQALGTPEERKEKMYDTALLSRHALAATWVASTIGSPAHNLPRIDSVPVESIQDNLIVVEEMPGLVKSWQGTRYVWLARNRKLEWPNMFRIGP